MTKTITLSFILFINILQLSYAKDLSENLNYSAKVNQLNTEFYNLLYSTDAQKINELTIISPQEKIIILENNDQYQIEKIIHNQTQKYIEHLKKLIQSGDDSATLTLFQWIVDEHDTTNLQLIDLEPLKRLAEKNNPQANFLMAQFFKHSENYLNYLEISAISGYLMAQITLAYEYSSGLPQERQNLKRATYWAMVAEQSVGTEKYQSALCELEDCNTSNMALAYLPNPQKDLPIKSASQVSLNSTQ